MRYTKGAARALDAGQRGETNRDMATSGIEARDGRGFRYTAILPTRNAAEQIDRQIESLRGQTLPPERILVVDSCSSDDTVRRAQSHAGVECVVLGPGAFDHGGTRDMAVRRCDTPFAVLMTQDALPMDANCMAALLSPMADARVAAVCARQVARPEATHRERAIRAFRYPEESRTWDRADVRELGIRAYLLSDVCAAYRCEAYRAVGGFAHPIATNEDMLIAADFLDAGYRLAYRADARVWHSHSFTLAQEYRRNRLIGGFLARYAQRFESGEMGEGMRLVREVTSALVKGGHWGELIPFYASCAAKLLGSRAGRRAARRRSDGQA